MNLSNAKELAFTKCLNTYYYPYKNTTNYSDETAKGIWEECEERHSVLVAGYIMIVLLSILLLPMVYITYKVK